MSRQIAEIGRKPERMNATKSFDLDSVNGLSARCPCVSSRHKRDVVSDGREVAGVLPQRVVTASGPRMRPVAGGEEEDSEVATVYRAAPAFSAS